MKTKINSILYELQETWGYTTEELDHIHDQLVMYGRELLVDESLQHELDEEELIDE